MNEQIKTLSEDNDLLENYFRNTIIPQLFVDDDLILQKFTPPAMTEFNLSKGEVGTSMRHIKDNFRFPSIIDDITQVIESNEILEKEIQTTDRRWYQMNIIPFVEKKTNKTNGVIITFVEITMRILDLKDQEALIEDYETLLDTISHDVRAPLANLIMSMEMFKTVSAHNQEEFQDLLHIVDKSLVKMQTVISDLTESRKEAHRYKATDEPLNFKHILEDVRLTLSDNLSEAGAVIKSEIVEPDIIFSKRKLRSVVYNLINNAIKFRSPDRKPQIFVTTSRENDYIVLSVKDNGIGINFMKQEAVFSKYYRAENKIEGSGIGLYLVKEIVSKAGGKIELLSEVGKGTEFKIYLKAKPE